MVTFKFFWTFLPVIFSIFDRLCSTFRDLLLEIYLNLAFIIQLETLLHVIYLYILKSVKMFKQRTDWKNSFWLKYYALWNYHMSFNLVGGFRLQYQWKSISLLRGFSVSVQCSSSNSKNILRDSFKSSVHLRK